MIRRNVAGQVIYLPQLTTVDGVAITSAASITVAKDGVEASSSGTLTHFANGVWKYTPTQGETDAAIVGLVLTATGGLPVVLNLITTAANTAAVAFGANTTTPPTAAANADATLSSLKTGPSTGGNWPADSFGRGLLVGSQPQREVLVTGNGHVASTIHSVQTDAITGDGIAASAVTKVAAGVWSALTSGYSSATGSFGLVIHALSTMIEYVSGVWRWAATSLTQAPTGGGGSGQYAITAVASSTSGVVQGTTFSIVGTAYSQTTRSSGQVVFNLDAGTYTLRTTPPPNYEAVADHSFTVSANATITRTLVPVAVAPAVIQGAPSASLTLRPAIDRRTPLLTLASVVDHLLLLDEINPGEPRSVERATKAARDALSSFASYSTQGFRYYESRAKIVMPGTVSLGTITVSNGVFTMPGAFTMPSWAPLGHVSIDRNNNKVYPVLLVNGQSITVDTLPNGTYSNVYLEQMFFPLPRNFRRRGTLSDGKNNWPVEDMSGGALQSLSDYYRWVGFSEFDRRFSAVTMDQRQQGDLMLAVWPPFKERVELSMFFERYPEALKHHRVGNSAATLSVTGSTATSTHAIFNDSHIGAAITIGLTSDQELLKSMASESLIDTQRIIRYVSSPTQVILDTPVATPVSSRAFYISDVVDVQSGIMSEAYKRLAEYEMLRQTKGSKADKKLQEFVQAFQMTQSDDSRHKPSVDPFSSPVGGNMWGEVKGRP